MREQSNYKFFSAPSLLELGLKFVVNIFNKNPEKYFAGIMNLPEDLREKIIDHCQTKVVETALKNPKLLEQYKNGLSAVNSPTIFIKILNDEKELRKQCQSYLPKNIVNIMDLIEIVKKDKYFVADNSFSSPNEHGIYQGMQNPALFLIKQRNTLAIKSREHGSFIMQQLATFEFDVPTLLLKTTSEDKQSSVDLNCFLEMQTLKGINSIISNPIELTEAKKPEENAPSPIRFYGGRR